MQEKNPTDLEAFPRGTARELGRDPPIAEIDAIGFPTTAPVSKKKREREREKEEREDNGHSLRRTRIFSGRQQLCLYGLGAQSNYATWTPRIGVRVAIVNHVNAVSIY